MCEQVHLAKGEVQRGRQGSDDEAAVPPGFWGPRGKWLPGRPSAIFPLLPLCLTLLQNSDFLLGSDILTVSSVLNGVEPALKLVLPWESIISFSWSESVMNY